MFAQDQQSFEAWMKPSQDVFNYWISFFPTAPLFGVEWRFGEMMGQGTSAAPASKSMSAKTKAVKADPTPIAHQRVEPQVAPKDEVETGVEEVVPAVEAAPIAVMAEIESVAVSVAEADENAPVKPKGLLAKAPADADDLKQIKGVGPGLEKQLNDLGIYRFRQLAKFKEDDLAWVDENLSSFKGRCFRDDWVGQAKALKA